MRALAVLLLVATALVLVLTWALSEDEKHDAGLSSLDQGSAIIEEAAVDEVRVEPTAAGTVEDARTAVTPNASAPSTLGPIVRSSTGLAITWAWLVSADGGGGGIDLVDRRLVLGDDYETPAAISAPGHVPTPFDPNAAEIVLEPDGLLVLDGVGPETCVTGVVPCAGTYVEDAREPLLDDAREQACFGMLGDGRFAIAFGMGVPASAALGRSWKLSVFRRDRTKIELAFPSRAGLRAEWKVPCDDVVPSAPLAIEVVRPAGDRRGEVVVDLGPVDVDPDPEPMEIDLGWAEASTTRAGRLPFERVLDPASSRLVIDDLPLGARYALSAHDRASGAFARVAVDHDGSVRRLVLERGWSVHGLLVARGVDPLLPERAWVSWERSGSPRPSRFEGIVDLGPDGRFEARGPNRFSFGGDPAAPIVPASELRLWIAAAGFESATRSLEAGSERDVDCGTIELVARRFALTFAGAHGIPTEITSRQPQLRLSLDGGRAWQRGEVDDARFYADGRLTLYFGDKGSGDDAEWFETYSMDPAVETNRFGGDRIGAVYFELPGGRHFFARARSGWFERVATATRRVALVRDRAHEQPRNLNVGWEWRGISVTVANAPPPGETGLVSLEVPEHDVRVWWGSLLSFPPGWDPPYGEGALVPLTASLERIPIP